MGRSENKNTMLHMLSESQVDSAINGTAEKPEGAREGMLIRKINTCIIQLYELSQINCILSDYSTA